MIVNASDFYQAIRIKYAQATMMELQYAFLAQTAQYTIDVDEGETRRVTEMFLSERQIHFLDPIARPLRATTDEQFQDQAGNALARTAPADAGQVIEGKGSVAAQGTD